MVEFEMLHSSGSNWVGPYLSSWLDPNVPGTAQEQLGYHCRHGGGWQPFKGWTNMNERGVLFYPGDPPQYPVARAQFRDQTVFVYAHSWIGVRNVDGTYEVCRMD